MRTVHLRISDDAGQPTPARVRLTGPDGTFYPPLGHAAIVPTGRGEDVGGGLWLAGERWAILSGGCEVPLPAGVPIRVQVQKGPEFSRIDDTVTLGPGQIALRFTMRRVLDWRGSGWCSADLRAHFLTPDAALTEAQAEGLNHVQLLAFEERMPSFDGHTYQTFPGLTAFSGQHPPRVNSETSVATNTLNVHPVLGKLALLHTHRVVFPLRFGAPDADDSWSLSAWCEQAHRKGGCVVWVEPFNPPHGGEALVALVQGLIDAVEVTPLPGKVPFLPAWYRLLTAGFRVPIVGASGRDSNRVPLGAMRTSAQLAAGEPLTLANLFTAIKAGRTVATTGPLIELNVADQPPGGSLAAGSTFPVQVTARSRTEFDAVEVVHDGKCVGRAAATSDATGTFTATLAFDLTPTCAGWLAARTTGAGFAHTSPITFTGPPAASRQPARVKLAEMLHLSREWVAEQGVFPTDAMRTARLKQWDDALEKLTAG